MMILVLYFLVFENFIDTYNDFTDGWNILLRKRDKGDFEWEAINYFLFSIFPWFVFITFLTELLKQTDFVNSQIVKLWQIITSIMFILWKFGTVSVAVILFQPIFFLIFISLKNKTVLWFCNLSCIALINFYKQINVSESFLQYFNLSEFKSYIIILGLSWINLRCISFSLDYINLKFTLNTCIDLLSYCLYLPTLFCGPFILYEHFEGSVEILNFSSIRHRITTLLKNLTRCCFWLIFGNFSLHYIYVNAAGYQPEFIRSFDAWSIYGYGYAMGQFFHIKFVVIYGFSTALAAFENVTVPHLPRCIGRVHLYSDMWKYFDPGLHTFLVRHIYIPTMKSHFICSRIVGSLLCFIYVYLWHGVEGYVCIWACLNYLGVTIEYVCGKLYKTHLETMHFVKNLTPSTIRRIKCMAASPLLAMTAVSNFYFFAGTEIGNIFFKKIFQGTFFANTFLLIALYSCCQISTELRLKNANKM